MGFMLVSDLKNFAKWYQKSISVKSESIQKFLLNVKNQLGAVTSIVKDPKKVYVPAFGKLAKYWVYFRETILSVGQKQLIRRQFCFSLNFAAKVRSKLLYCALEAMSAALLSDVQQHYRKPDTK